MTQITIWHVIELELHSTKSFNNPLADVTLKILFTSPDGREIPIEGFWNGGQTWRVRFSPDMTGQWRWQSTCSEDSGLNAQTGEFECVAYKGENPLYQHGALKVSADGHSFTYADDTPFFWLADTAWNGVLRARPDDWEHYLQTRQKQDFTAIQFVLTQWRGAADDSAGELAYTGENPLMINSAFFQRMDAKIELINAYGMIASPVMLWALTPTDPGCALSVEDRILLARYEQARYGAYQVVWMVGGDGCYNDAIEDWRQIGRIVFADRHDRLVTLHPCGVNWSTIALRNENWFDFVGYQSGHGGSEAHIRWATQGEPATDWKDTPVKPFMDIEPNYENHPHTQANEKGIYTDYEVRRASYWSMLVSPPAGVTYGTNAIWVWRDDIGEAENHPRLGDVLPWQYGLNLPGVIGMIHLRALFESFAWWTLRPAQSLLRVQPGNTDPYSFVAAAQSPDKNITLIYTPPLEVVSLDVTQLPEQNIARWYNVRTGAWLPADVSEPGIYPTPDDRDWCLLIEAS